MTPLARVELELVDPSRNAKRFYAMTVMPEPQLALFPDLELEALLVVRAWGRIGKRPTVRRQRFTDLALLAELWNELLAVRKRHGYVITQGFT